MSRWPNKYVIGLTGNIAVGKSVVRQMLQHLGAYTIDADSLSHRAMAPGAPAYKPIVETFGQFILDAEKNINRQMLGNIVFSSPDALAKLEAIVHPVVAQAIGALISRATQPVIVVEAIKLLEGNLKDAVDTVWVVDASPEMQLQRLIEKRKMSEAEARQRIAAQNAQSDKLSKAGVVIQNNGNVEETWKQVQSNWSGLAQKLKTGTGTTPAVAAPAAPAAPAVSAPPPAPPKPAAPAVTAAPAASAPVVEPPRKQTAPLSAPPEMPSAPPAPAANVRVHVRRGMPGNAEQIANFVSKISGRSVSRMDVMMAFGQKSYLLALDQTDQVLAVMGWQVENLITRADEVFMAPGAPVTKLVEELVTAVEAASKDLQSEVAYIFLPQSTDSAAVTAFADAGYESTTVEQIKVPAWRESVQEALNATKAAHIFSKKLGNRILKPI